MQLKDQVVSLELSKRLKESCVKQHSIFFWSKLSMQNEYHLELRANLETSQIILADCSDYISAFTVSELSELLPNNIEEKYFTSHRCKRHGWWVFYSKFNDKDTDNDSCWDFSEADARAKMLIFLIENGHIDAKDLNK